MTAARGLTLAALLASAPAHADPVAVRVIDRAGEVAYVAPGRDAGLVPGTVVRFGALELTVVEATRATAVVRIGERTLAIGATGTALVSAAAADGPTARLAPPRPLEAWRAQWPAARRPADGQTPTPVPLGVTAVAGRLQAALALRGVAVLADEPTGTAELRATVAYQLLADRPLTVALDVSGRWFGAGRTGARAPLRVHAAQLGWGDAAAPRWAIGRLPWAGTGVGPLDGVRASWRRGAVETTAYVGLDPDPIDGRPSADAARFGAEVAYDAPDRPGAPRLGLALTGSTWDGGLDDQRATASVDLRRGDGSVTGWAEAQAFADDNPWGAAAIELVGAGAAASWHRPRYHGSVEVGFARPDRSRRLAEALPASWLCGATAGPPGTDPARESCAGGDAALGVAAAAGLTVGAVTLDAMARTDRTTGPETDQTVSGLVVAGVAPRPRWRVEVGGAGGRGGFLDWYAGETAVRYTPARRSEVTARYRSELLAYLGALDRLVLHTVELGGRLSPASRVELAIAAAATTGLDRDAVTVVTSLSWRPAP